MASAKENLAFSVAMGQDMGLRGTPALVLENGDMVPGYVEPKRLAALLEKAGK